MTAADQPTTEPTATGLRIEHGWLVEETTGCTCAGGTEESSYLHEPGCGLTPLQRLDNLPGWPAPAPQPAADTEPLRFDDWERRFRAADADANALAERVVKAEEEVARQAAVIKKVRNLADRWEHGALRWANPLPVPPEVEQLRRALDGGAS